MTQTVGDPYGGTLLTAGNPYAAADGSTFLNQPANVVSEYMANYGSQDVAARVWAEASNENLLTAGQAIRTDQGVVGLGQALYQLQQQGYTGSADATSVANAFAMLHTPKPSSLPSPSSPSSATGLSLGNLGELQKPLLLIGGAYLLYEFVLKGGRR